MALATAATQKPRRKARVRRLSCVAAIVTNTCVVWLAFSRVVLVLRGSTMVFIILHAATKAVGDGEESFVLFVGSKQSGKTTLVTQFLNPAKEVAPPLLRCTRLIPLLHMRTCGVYAV